jgi:hypothetical protein
MYTVRARLPVTVKEAIPYVLDQLKLEDVGVLMDLDIQATMKQKIGPARGVQLVRQENHHSDQSP